MFIIKVTEQLVNNGIEGEDIGIITPYNSQANLIRHAVYTTSVEIHTIDKYQVRLSVRLLFHCLYTRNFTWTEWLVWPWPFLLAFITTF